ncbi:hypothetical protein, partial [Exiguobacterium sp. s142]|uniref:hypothetical protein n=1 Tax=Exiguobacterium sp. s142 TaxID=2751222 RepID=UPI001BE5708F
SDEELKIKLYSEMIDKIKELIRRELGNKGRQDLLDWSNELVELAGMYLKEEWERVKIESHSGRTFKSTKVNQNSQLILLLFAGLYIIVGTLITAFFTELSWGLTFILFSFITYTIFVPFMKEVLAGEHFNRKTYNICVSVFEVSLWVVIIALIKLLFINTEIETSSEWMIYIYLLILLVLRNFIKFRSLIM